MKVSAILLLLAISVALTGCFDKARYAAGEICQCAEKFGELTRRLDAGEDIDMRRLRNESIKAEQCVAELKKQGGGERDPELEARVYQNMKEICPETMKALLGEKFLREGEHEERRTNA